MNTLDNLLQLYQKIERTIGGLKFAVVLITLMILCLVAGTILESTHGTDFANRLLYKSIPFMLLQFFLFLSIAFAALLRMPPQKRLYGFYCTHLGLVTILLGSFITYRSGLDGQITLTPNEPNAHVDILTSDELVMTFDTKEYTVPLPYTPFKRDINYTINGITLLEYLPFSDLEVQWVENREKQEFASSAYRLYNDFVSQDLVMSSNPENNDFPSSTTLGLLNAHYLPEVLFECFHKIKKQDSQLIIWNVQSNFCFTPEERKIPINKTSNGKVFLAFKVEEGKIATFLPDHSPYALNEKLEVDQFSPYRILNLKIFGESPNLFLLGKKLTYLDQEGNWVLKELSAPVKLPWMNFQIELNRHETALHPVLVPIFHYPVQEGDRLVKGASKAIKISVLNKEYWVSTEKPLGLHINNEKITFRLRPKSFQLPFSINLDFFNMDHDPGTKNPASYESNVTVMKSGDFYKTLIKMNNPLKEQSFTIYQASYFPLEEGKEEYGSVLSVNFDPGRPIKYLGSLILVLGTIWHFYLNRKRKF